MTMNDASETGPWPSLPLEAWNETYATLHMWTQIVGKIRLAQTPWINHSWGVTFYVTSRGLTTSAIPYGTRTFQIDFDFIDHQLLIRSADGSVRAVALRPQSVASFLRLASVVRSVHGCNNDLVPLSRMTADVELLRAGVAVRPVAGCLPAPR